MAISKVKLPDNTTEDINDSRISFDTVEGYGLLDVNGLYELPNAQAYALPGSDFSQDAPSGTILLADDSAVVHIAGSETITGEKTFTTGPILANNISLYGYDTDGTTQTQLIKVDSANNVRIAEYQGRGSGEYTKLYGDNIWFCNYLSDTAGPNIYIGNTSTGSHNQAAGYIYFNSVLTAIRNGFKIGAELGSSADRLNLNFYTSNNGTSPYAPSWNKAFSIKYDGDSEFTGNIIMSSDKYVMTPNSSSMLGISSSNEFLCGPGYEASGGFYLCSDNNPLKHRRYSDSSTYNEWNIWDGSNANRDDCNWSVKDLLVYNHIHLPNNKCLYVKDTSSNDVRALYMSTADNLFIGRDLVGLGNTYLYGEEVAVRAGGTSTVLNVTSTGVTVTGNLTVSNASNIVFSDSSQTLNDILGDIETLINAL